MKNVYAINLITTLHKKYGPQKNFPNTIELIEHNYGKMLSYFDDTYAPNI
jgi:hypothetical protein